MTEFFNYRFFDRGRLREDLKNCEMERDRISAIMNETTTRKMAYARYESSTDGTRNLCAGRSKTTLYRWIQQGLFKVENISGHLYV